MAINLCEELPWSPSYRTEWINIYLHGNFEWKAENVVHMKNTQTVYLNNIINLLQIGQDYRFIETLL